MNRDIYKREEDQVRGKRKRGLNLSHLSIKKLDSKKTGRTKPNLP